MANVMYSVQPVWDENVTYEHNDSMFNVRELYTIKINPDNRPKLNSKVEECEVLERQEELISKLENLLDRVKKFNEEIENLKTQGKSVKKQRSVNQINNKNINNDIHEDVKNMVLNVDPIYPSWSLLWFPGLFQIPFTFHTHVHSSIVEFPSKLNEFEHWARKSADSSSAASNAYLIWKSVGRDPQLVLSSFKYKPISGEVNILRVLESLAAVPPSQEPHDQIVKDELLDVAHSLRHSTNRERHDQLAELEKRLGQNDWFSGKSTPNIVDAAVWSVLRSLGIRSTSLGASMKCWLSRSDTFVNA